LGWHYDIGNKANLPIIADLINRMKHHKWLANPVLVPKKNNTWRMCIDADNSSVSLPKWLETPVLVIKNNSNQRLCIDFSPMSNDLNKDPSKSVSYVEEENKLVRPRRGQLTTTPTKSTTTVNPTLSNLGESFKILIPLYSSYDSCIFLGL
jgi:hypothetical protein